MKLIEKVVNKYVLNENVQKDGVLCRLIYPICNIGERNHNDRIYEEALWDRVEQDKNIKEKLNNRTLFGQAEHPKEETQSNLEKTSHIVTRIYREKELFEGKEILKEKAEIEILDTPYGRIVNTLLRAGCNVGVSTRADGELEEAVDEAGNKFNRVIPEQYRFITVDFTADPSTFSPYAEKVEHNIVCAVQQGVGEKKMDKAYGLSLLENFNSDEAKEVKRRINGCDGKCAGKCNMVLSGVCACRESDATAKVAPAVTFFSQPEHAEYFKQEVANGSDLPKEQRYHLLYDHMMEYANRHFQKYNSDNIDMYEVIDNLLAKFNLNLGESKNGPSDEEVNAMAWEMFKQHWNALGSAQQEEVYRALGVQEAKSKYSQDKKGVKENIDVEKHLKDHMDAGISPKDYDTFEKYYSTIETADEYDRRDVDQTEVEYREMMYDEAKKFYNKIRENVKNSTSSKSGLVIDGKEAGVVEIRGKNRMVIQWPNGMTEQIDLRAYDRSGNVLTLKREVVKESEELITDDVVKAAAGEGVKFVVKHYPINAVYTFEKEKDAEETIANAEGNVLLVAVKDGVLSTVYYGDAKAYKVKEEKKKGEPGQRIENADPAEAVKEAKTAEFGTLAWRIEQVDKVMELLQAGKALPPDLMAFVETDAAHNRMTPAGYMQELRKLVREARGTFAQKTGDYSVAMKGVLESSKNMEYRVEIESIGQGHYYNSLADAAASAISKSKTWGPDYVVRLEKFKPERAVLVRYRNGEEIGLDEAKTNEVKVNERTTWLDLGWTEKELTKDGGVTPDLTGYSVMYVPTGEKFKIKSADEKFVQLADELDTDKYIGMNNSISLGVGDAFVYAKKWKLINPQGKEVPVNKGGASNEAIIEEAGSYAVGTKVIVNTQAGASDQPGVITDISGRTNEKAAHGSYWKEQDAYLVQFDNGTTQYMPASMVRTAGEVKEDKAVREGDGKDYEPFMDNDTRIPHPMGAEKALDKYLLKVLPSEKKLLVSAFNRGWNPLPAVNATEAVKLAKSYLAGYANARAELNLSANVGESKVNEANFDDMVAYFEKLEQGDKVKLTERIGAVCKDALVEKAGTVTALEGTLKAKLLDIDNLKENLRKSEVSFKDEVKVLKESHEKEVADLVKKHERALIEKYITTVLGYTKLDLNESSLTLLKSCATEQEVDTLLDKFRVAVRENALHFKANGITVQAELDPATASIVDKMGKAFEGMGK